MEDVEFLIGLTHVRSTYLAILLNVINRHSWGISTYVFERNF